MTGMLADSHCHLDFDDFDTDREAVLERARSTGVGGILVAAVAEEHWQRVQDLAGSHPGIWAAAGVHPNEKPGGRLEWEHLLQALQAEKVVATGETGLDYFRSEGPMDWQKERFSLHIAAAKATGRPLIVHTRQAAADTIALLETEGARDCGGVIHCFTEDWNFAQAAMDLGFHISFSGIVTFRNSSALQDVARKIPRDRLLVETDSPFLAPVPVRGKRNEPGFVAHVANFLAELRQESPERLAEYTTENFCRLFQISMAE